jgi:hypothetical protein
MAAIFNIQPMRRDFQNFQRASGKFLERSSRLDELQRELDTAVKSLSNGETKLSWGTADEPIRTIKSTHYRNASTGAKNMWAEIAIEMTGVALDNQTRMRVDSGSTSIKFFRDGDQSIKEIHFDIHGEKAGTTAGHPVFHAQTIGWVNDIPRIPIPFVHPVDIIEFALMELFQQQWRSHRTGTSARSILGAFRLDQMFRLERMLTWMKDCICDASALSPMLEFQRHPNSSLPLHRPSS